MIFYRISELKLATLIQRQDKTKKNISFQKRETYWHFTGCQMPHFVIVILPYIKLLNLSIDNKMSIFKEHGAFKNSLQQQFILMAASFIWEHMLSLYRGSTVVNSRSASAVRVWLGLYNMGRAMQKHMRTAKAQTSAVGICGQWWPRSACASTQSDQGLHCPLQCNRVIGYYRTPEWRAKARMILCACAG